MSYSFARGSSVQYSVIDTAGRMRRSVDIAVTGAPMMHDFSLTEKYVVVYDLPVTFDSADVLPVRMPRWLKAPARMVLSSLIGRSGCPARSPRWSTATPGPDRDALLVECRLPRAHRGDAARGRAEGALVRGGILLCLPPGQRLHRGLAAGHELLVLDVVRYTKMFEVDRHGPGDVAPTLDRWTIDLDTGAVSTEARDDRPQEFPRINEALTGAKHRFGYTMGIQGGFVGGAGAPMSTALYKHDYLNGTSLTAPLDPALVIGEMSFVPRPGGREEDDGVLIGMAHHRGDDEGRLLILDAASCEPVATVHLPQRVPMGFHGNWTPVD